MELRSRRLTMTPARQTTSLVSIASRWSFDRDLRPRLASSGSTRCLHRQPMELRSRRHQEADGEVHVTSSPSPADGASIATPHRVALPRVQSMVSIASRWSFDRDRDPPAGSPQSAPVSIASRWSFDRDGGQLEGRAALDGVSIASRWSFDRDPALTLGHHAAGVVSIASRWSFDRDSLSRGEALSEPECLHRQPMELRSRRRTGRSVVFEDFVVSIASRWSFDRDGGLPGSRSHGRRVSIASRWSFDRDAPPPRAVVARATSLHRQPMELRSRRVHRPRPPPRRIRLHRQPMELRSRPGDAPARRSRHDAVSIASRWSFDRDHGRRETHARGPQVSIASRWSFDRDVSGCNGDGSAFNLSPSPADGASIATQTRFHGIARNPARLHRQPMELRSRRGRCRRILRPPRGSPSPADGASIATHLTRGAASQSMWSPSPADGASIATLRPRLASSGSTRCLHRQPMELRSRLGEGPATTRRSHLT